MSAAARRALSSCVVALVAGCATIAAPPESAKTLVSTGKLRVGVNLGNPALAKRDEARGEVTGISMDLGGRLASHFGAQATAVTYANAGQLLDGGKKGEWDIAFAAIDRTREDVVAFTPAYMEVVNTYLVRNDSSIRNVGDADKAGVRIGVGEKNLPDVFLSRNLKNAQVVRVADNHANAVELLKAGGAEVFAGNLDRLRGIQGELPGYRIVEGRFNTVQQAIMLPKAKEAALPYVSAFVGEAKAKGWVAESIARHGIRGVEVAP